jgi:site-specific DNA-methyltransferase (adenine-specific)
MKKYTVVLADPPWPYDDKAAAGKRGVEFKYDVMTERNIRLLNVDHIAGDDCALFLWATPPRLPLALAAMRAWGFTYKTIAFTWIKTRSEGKLHWGMGNWTRANPEHVLLGVRGNVKGISHSVHSVVMSELRGHSAKPPEVRDKIVELMGDVPRVELFAREKVVGWDAWGREVENDFEFPGAADLLSAMSNDVDKP